MVSLERNNINSYSVHIYKYIQTHHKRIYKTNIYDNFNNVNSVYGIIQWHEIQILTNSKVLVIEHNHLQKGHQMNVDLSTGFVCLC